MKNKFLSIGAVIFITAISAPAFAQTSAIANPESTTNQPIRQRVQPASVSKTTTPLKFSVRPSTASIATTKQVAPLRVQPASVAKQPIAAPATAKPTIAAKPFHPVHSPAIAVKHISQSAATTNKVPQN